VDCKTASGLIEDYLDNELDRAEARELEAHVDACADCRAALNRLDALRRSLRDDALRYPAPASLRERIAATALEQRITPVRNRPLHSLWGMAAACVLAVAAGGAGTHWWDSSARDSDRSAQVTRDLFASHWRALAAASPVDVVSTDRHTVKPWFAGKIAEAPLVQDFADQGFALVGGRIDYVGSERVPVLVYRHGQHLIDVFVMPKSSLAAAQEKGYGVVPTSLGGQPAAIVSDMDAHEMAAFEQLLAAPK
jgi:anti-sigma factor RsiW